MEFTHHEFLYGRKIDPDICDGLIEYFEETPMGTHNIPYEDGRYWICLKKGDWLVLITINQMKKVKNLLIQECHI